MYILSHILHNGVFFGKNFPVIDTKEETFFSSSDIRDLHCSSDVKFFGLIAYIQNVFKEKARSDWPNAPRNGNGKWTATATAVASLPPAS